MSRIIVKLMTMLLEALTAANHKILIKQQAVCIELDDVEYGCPQVTLYQNGIVTFKDNEGFLISTHIQKVNIIWDVPMPNFDESNYDMDSKAMIFTPEIHGGETVAVATSNVIQFRPRSQVKSRVSSSGPKGAA